MSMRLMSCRNGKTLWAVSFFMLICSPTLSAQQKKPNPLVTMGDDAGYWNNSAHNRVTLSRNNSTGFLKTFSFAPFDDFTFSPPEPLFIASGNTEPQ